MTCVLYMTSTGTVVAQWLRRCATNRKVAGSIPAGVSGFFIDIKRQPVRKADNPPPSVPLSRNLGTLTS